MSIRIDGICIAKDGVLDIGFSEPYTIGSCWISVTEQSKDYIEGTTALIYVTADSVRPLSVLPMFRRIFKSLLIPGFTDVKSPWTRLHPCQAGFRKGYSTLSDITIAHHGLSTK